MGDPVGQDTCLAAPGAGQHEQGSIAVEHGFALRRVQPGEEVSHPRSVAEPPGHLAATETTRRAP
jgi:hypothetical protein